MNAQPLSDNPQVRWLTRGRSIVIWLAAFLSPTAYFLLLMLADKFQFPSPPEALAVVFFYSLPPVALLACGAVVWLSKMHVAAKIVCTLFSLAGIAIQIGAILLIFITAAIGLP